MKPIFARLTDVARMDVQLEINVYVGLNRNIRIVSKYFCPLTEISIKYNLQVMSYAGIEFLHIYYQPSNLTIFTWVLPIAKVVPLRFTATMATYIP